MYHQEQFHAQKTALYFYYAFSISIFLVLTILNVLKTLKIVAVIDQYVAIIIINFFPVIQAVGVCVLKPATDPLSEVNALFYLKIVSIN